jgi:hypothetical protein
MKFTKKRFVIPETTWKYMLEYSKLDLPISRKLTEEEKLLTCNRGDMRYYWAIPKRTLITKCLFVAKKMAKYFPQWNLDGTEGHWLVKPGNATKGAGVMCINSLQSMMTHFSKLKSRVVQKLVERPLLLDLNKKLYSFDIK